MDVAATSTALMQAGTQGDLQTAALRTALKTERSVADFVAQAVQTSAPVPAGMGRHVDMTV